jgi:DNA-binding MarR family transcriptional regulator
VIRVSSDVLDEMVFKLLKEIHKLENHDMEKFGLSWRDVHVLKYLLRRSPCRVSDIANELNMPLFAVSRLLAALSERGMITKAKNDIDRRNTHLSLTPEGARIIKQVQAHHYNLFTTNLELMEEKEATQMLSSMGNVGRLLESISTKKRIDMDLSRKEDVYAAEVAY